jgi:hypothetical protein
MRSNWAPVLWVLSIASGVLAINIFVTVTRPEPFKAEWDLGEGVVNLVGTLLGVLAAFALEDRIRRRGQRERYAEALQTCGLELAGLLVTCRRIQSQFSPDTYLIDDLNRPAAIAMLLQSPGLHQYGTYVLRAALTSLAPSIDAVRPRIEICRQPTRRVEDLTRGAAATGQLIRLLRFVVARIEAELRRLGVDTTVRAEDRAAMEELRGVLRSEEAH